MAKTKNLSNPFSTGGGGPHFEAHVQASFVTLMLTGGHAPCLPCWPIKKIKLQAKKDGFDTDDLVVFVENPISREQRKLLGQVKHCIPITQGSTILGEVMQAAWNDFNNPEVFSRNEDIIALITGPLSATDSHNVQWLLNQARHTKTVDEFYRNVEQANFSPPKSNEKLQVIQHHLKIANDGNDLSRDELYGFLRHFHLIGYDLGTEFGVILSLLHSHISQFQQQYPQQLWARVVDIVQTWNQDAGTITHKNLPEDLLEAFKQKAVIKMPEEFKLAQAKPKTDWIQHPDVTYLALAVLIGAWDENKPSDVEVISQFLGIEYETWLQKARELLLRSDSPLSLKNGIWKVVNRAELWSLLGSHVLDQNLDSFQSLAIQVLKEPDPAFELAPEERYAASIFGKVMKHSQVLREGIAEGLAILGSQPDACRHCSQGKTEITCMLVIRELLADIDWRLWGSLNSLLPTLAEAAPREFIDAVEKALALTPCPFDDLFSQESNGITGRNYLYGLFWALEGLAWDEQYFVRVCVVFGELASHDPGGQSRNRPFNSLTTILLPWLPQTLASIDKRKVAVKALLRECPDIAWNLIIRLLPKQKETSLGTHKPKWRKLISDAEETSVTIEEYWQQVSFYAETAVSLAAADFDTVKLSVLIDHFDGLPKPAFDQLVEVLASQPIFNLSEEQRLSLWNHLTKFMKKHRRYSDSEWALPGELISCVEEVAKKIAPTDSFNLYQHLFSNSDYDLFEENSGREKLDIRREMVILELFQQHGTGGIVRFAESVVSPEKVGYALGVINNDMIEKNLLPSFLDTSDNKRKALVGSFVWRRYHIKGWEWCDSIDKSSWKPKQIGQFLAYLPFTKEVWDRASEWLQENEGEYWSRTGTNAYEVDDNISAAIEKLIKYGRPYSAISCLERMKYAEQLIDTHQCIRVLLAALTSSESSNTLDSHCIIELIKFLQSESSVNQDDLFKVEWAYLPLLDGYSGGVPKLLERTLASSPEFFTEIIQLIYRSEKEDQPSKQPTQESISIANNAWQLLHKWKTPPGTQEDGTFSEEHFTIWLQHVKAICSESGHLEAALSYIGEVLVHAPADPSGLWLHRAVATALNGREEKTMRSGFETATYNLRGVHCVDPTGTPERLLAEQFRSKAEEIENAGFHRLAVTLRGLADGYDRDAERIISNYKDR
jgi:hypothetical protein